MKKIIKILKDPSTLSKPETKFFDEIHTKEFKTNRVNEEYLKSFRKERTAVQKSDRSMAIYLALFTLIVIGMAVYAVYKHDEQKQEVATRELSIKLLSNK